DMACKAVRIERAFRDERRHSGAPVLTGNGDAIDDGIPDARTLRKGIGDLDCRYILALPAERIADTVDEIEIAVRILLHQIAGAEPAVALLLDIAENFRLRRLGIGIALETVGGLGRIVGDEADHLAGFVRLRLDDEAVRPAHRLLALDIEPHDLDRKAAGDPPRNAA